MTQKEFFIQYLPVDGEIKVGDKHMCLSNQLVCDTTEENDFYVNNKNHKKVKLFVCSRNINEGDTRINMWTRKHGSLISDKKNATFVCFLPNGRANIVYEGGSASVDYPFESSPDVEDMHGFTGDAYKVIGEVSEDAIWIKEGMTFDKEDIKIFFGIDVKKTFSNGETNTILTFSELPSDEDIQSSAEYWGERVDSSGWSNGYRLYWENKPFVKIIKIKCTNCNHFH